MSEGKIKMGMAARLRLSKCCCCLSLDQGAKVVGGVLLLFTLGQYSLFHHIHYWLLLVVRCVHCVPDQDRGYP